MEFYDPYKDPESIYGPNMPIDPKTFKGWLSFLWENPVRWMGMFYAPAMSIMFGVSPSPYPWLSLAMAGFTAWIFWYSWKAYGDKLWMEAKSRAFKKAYPNYKSEVL